MSSGLAKGRDVWKYRNGNQANAAERPATEPAPTVHFGHASNAVDWVHDRPAPTVVGSRRSEDGMLVGRQLPPGEGRNIGGRDWVDGRPATTIAGDSRVFQPGGHHEPGQQSQNAVRVSVQEASILQSFPPDYPWQGSRTKQYEQIGNAVPPTMAQAVLGALLDSDCARLTGGSRSFPVDPGVSGGVGS